jgi:putative nucleotidyltransferase with HDIG domain
MSELGDRYNFQDYEQWFQEYTQEFLVGSEFDVANVQLKIDHTMRVLEFARQIAAAQGPDGELTELAHLAALFHDVGRFPQYSRYRTFHDQISVNHAYQGVVTLKRERVLEKLPPAARKLVLGAVALHNRRSLPRGLPRKLADLTRMVRDADKLDIFQVMLAHFRPGVRHNKVVNLELKPDPDKYTPAILAQVWQREMVNLQEMVWVNDFKLLLCSWIYDLNYPVSRRVFRQRGYLEELLGYLPQTTEFNRLGQQLREDLAAGTIIKAI